jgi:hypothetical protein
MRDLGANVAPRSERPVGSQTHKSRRGLGESRYRGTLGDPGASLGQPGSRVTGELKALVCALVMGEPRHLALVEQFTVLEGALSIFFEIWWTRWDSNPQPLHCEQWGK